MKSKIFLTCLPLIDETDLYSYTNRNTKRAVEPDWFCWEVRGFPTALKVNPRNSLYGTQLTSPTYVKCFS